MAYISGHGFGHWTRSSAVLARLARRLPVHVRVDGPALNLARRAEWAASVERFPTGGGVVQRGPLEVDVPATRARLEQDLSQWERHREEGVHEARRLGARLVYGDAPPLAFEVAAELGVPGVALANFSWSWAYEHYAGDDPFFAQAAARLRAAESRASALIPLPGGGGLDAFGHPHEEAMFLRRAPTRPRALVRAEFPLPPGLSRDDPRPRVVLSFGGYGDRLDLSAAAAANPGFLFLSFSPPEGPVPANLTVLPHDHELEHQDLVFGADAVIAKPGYGTISECFTAGTPLAYVIPSDAFREHAYLERMIATWLPAVSLPVEQLLAGEWSGPLKAVVGRPPPRPAPPNPIEEVVARVEAHLD